MTKKDTYWRKSILVYKSMAVNPSDQDRMAKKRWEQKGGVGKAMFSYGKGYKSNFCFPQLENPTFGFQSAEEER